MMGHFSTIWHISLKKTHPPIFMKIISEMQLWT